MANNESSEVVDILLPVTFYFKPTMLDNVKNFWRFVISFRMGGDVPCTTESDQYSDQI